MSSHPTVLTYDVDVARLVELYRESQQARTSLSPRAKRRWSFRLPAPRLSLPVFGSRRTSGLGSDFPTATIAP